MKNRLRLLISVLFILPSFIYAGDKNVYSLSITVECLRNSKGIVQFSLYNKDDTIPDEEFKKFYKQKIGEIDRDSSTVVFNNLPKGRYAVNILHDENSNGKIDKGFIMPIEGIGFSNYTSIGLTNQPNFIDASFKLSSNIKKIIKVIYM